MPVVAIYARKSTESEDRQVLSIDSQINELRQHAKRLGVRIGKVYRESKSAKSPGRPIFTDVLDSINKGEISALLCWKLDRLARNPVDGGALIWAMEEEKLERIITPQRNFENTGSDKFWMQLEFGMAKKYVDDLSDNVRRGIKARVENGWYSGLAPFGYLNDKNTGTIVKDPERYDLVRRMWELMLTGAYTPSRILHIATEDWGLRTRSFKRTGGGKMKYSAIYYLFRNPFYYGKLTYGGEMYEGAHEPMVTKEEFDRVQEMISGGRNPRSQRHIFPFTGLIRCGECGASITAENKINRQGHHYVYYHCSKRKRYVRCGQRTVRAEVLENQISEFLQTITIGPNVKDWLMRMTRRVHAEESQTDEKRIASLQKREAACRRELSELMDLRLRGLISDDEYREKRQQLDTERHSLKELLADADGNTDTVIDRCEEAYDFASRLLSAFQTGSESQKKAILVATGSNLVLHDGKLSIHARKPFSFMQDATSTVQLTNGQFEPEALGYSSDQNEKALAIKGKWYTLVKEVRTFYLDHETLLPDIGSGWKAQTLYFN